VVLLIAFGIGAVAFMADSSAKDNVFGLVCLGWVFLLVGWLIMALIAQLTSIRPQEITDTSITLVGVSNEFTRAYEDEMPQVVLDDAVVERWNQPKSRPSSPPRRGAKKSDRVRRPGDDRLRP
jgi:hypothetical protein